MLLSRSRATAAPAATFARNGRMKPNIAADPEERMQRLVAERNRKMATSAHAYVRGSTTRFYEWLDASSRPALPEGPQTWICGDCHVGNLGPVASADGAIAIQVRDLDQTVIGNPAHDLIRLGLSLAMAARGSDLPGVTTAHILERMMDGYEAAFMPQTAAGTSDASSDMPKIARLAMRQAATAATDLPKAANARIRLMIVDKVYSDYPKSDLTGRGWTASTPE